MEAKSIVLVAGLLKLLVVLCLNSKPAAGRLARRLGQNEMLNYQMVEELPAGTLIGNIITDARLNLRYNTSEISRLRFSFLTQPDLDREYLSIEESSGILSTTHRIDRDKLCPQVTECFVKFDVAVSPVKYFQIIKIRVEILDKNDNAPYFPQSRITHQISESTLPGTSFSIPAATDPDSLEHGVQRYELVSSSDNFELKVRETADGATDLRLILMNELDREVVDFYQVKILAHDGGDPPKSGSVLIDVSVLDANDNDPVFENSTYEVSVQENVPIGMTIFRVKARDPDKGANGEIEYQLSRHTQQNYGSLFDIDSTTGEIFVKGALDYEKGAIYLLSLTAFDSGFDSLPAHATLIVRVQDMNDNAPQITVNTLTTSGDAQVAENTPPGTFVAHISIIDGDSGTNGKFTCSLSDHHFHLQKLYLTEYKIVTAAIFDRERLPYFDLTLECRDRGIPAQTSFAHIRVTILDDNDHTPKFSAPMYTATIIENNLIGEFIVAVTANDDDIDMNGRVKYKLGDDARGLVAIDDDTGSITANVVFDHEDLSELQFHVIATDQGGIPRTTTAKVLISIVDINDEIPHFVQESYTFGTFEKQPPSTEVGQVKAIDRDSEPYNHFSYSLDPELSPMDVFRINPRNGTIRTKKVLDREDQTVYYMVVVAASEDDYSLSSTVSVSVYVADKNDNAPVWDFPTLQNNSLRISNKVAIGQVISRLKAHDADSGKNARLNYLITDGNSNNAFAIDPSSGAISVNKELEMNDGDSFTLHVVVQDQGEPLLSAGAKLNIFVTKVAGYAKSRSINLSKDNLIIVIVFVVVTAIISMIIIATIVVIKRRDTEQRHNQENSKKELQRMLPPPPVEDANGAPGAKIKAGNAYVTAVEMDNLKKGLTRENNGGAGDPRMTASSRQAPQGAPQQGGGRRANPHEAEEVSERGVESEGVVVDPDDLPPPPESWRHSLGWPGQGGEGTIPCPAPLVAPPSRHHSHHNHPYSHNTTTHTTTTSSLPPPPPPPPTPPPPLPDEDLPEPAPFDLSPWAVLGLASDLEVSIAIHNMKAEEEGGEEEEEDGEEDAGSENTTSSNSDSGRGPSSIEGDVNHKLSMEAIEDVNPNAAKQRLLQGLHPGSSHSSRHSKRQASPTSPGRTDPGVGSGGGGGSANPLRDHMRLPSPGCGGHPLHPHQHPQHQYHQVSPTAQRAASATLGRMDHSQTLSPGLPHHHQHHQRSDLQRLPSPGRTDYPRLSPQRPEPGAPHTMVVGGAKTLPIPAKCPVGGSRAPNKMVTFGDTPQVFEEDKGLNVNRRFAPTGVSGPLAGPGSSVTPTAAPTAVGGPQAKVPMRIQRQNPPMSHSVNYRQQGAPFPMDYPGGSTGEEEEDEEEVEERAKPDGEVDSNGDYVIYNYDSGDARETNV